MTGLRIALIGYGKMGKTIHQIANERGHKVVLIIDIDQESELADLKDQVDVVIEFTRPEAAIENLTYCIKNRIPIVSGTTGWLHAYAEIKSLAEEHKSAFFYASNYSIGVNIFFAVNKYLAGITEHFDNYDIGLKEIHHTQKLDSPSGTAITLAEGIIETINRKNQWINEPSKKKTDLSIISERTEDDPGTHVITYTSDVDEITIKHQAHSRQGFALGAILAAEWLVGKQGCFGMNDLLKF
ncbi:MAG: 4-hydroxy-tetrahydrodipicolinate reductase [Saprospiraceae bacterium]|nr:4-hydroxy-tetrahydrodipicolinate reductase [Saprospiraceae bacterium]